MQDYRRGKKNGVWSKLWHWNEACEGYPSGTFAIRRDKPSDDELCARCHALGHG